MRCGIMNFLLLLLCTILIGLADIGCCKNILEPMRCYIGECSGHDEDTVLEECRHEGLISDCPRDQMYDSCFTQINRKAYGSITVVKGCGLRPCNPEAPLTPEEQREYDECQEFQFRDSYTCRVCCQHNSCNTATAISSIKSHYHNLILVTISLLFFFHYR